MNDKKFHLSKLHIRLLAFLTVVIIVLSLFSNFGIVEAAENQHNLVIDYNITSNDLLNMEDFQQSDVFVPDIYPFPYSNTNKFNNTLNYVNNNLFSYPLNVQDSFADIYLNNNNFLLCNGNDTSSFLYLLPDNSFVSYENGYINFYVPDIYIIENNLINSGGDEFYFTRFNFNNGVYTSFNNVQFIKSVFTVDGVNYRKASVNYDCIISNLPIYYNNGSAITTFNDVININYSPIVSGGDVQVSENSSNNLYMDNFVINYDITNLTGGFVTFNGRLNEWQKENISDFTIKYQYWFNIDVAYNVVGGKRFTRNAISTPVYDLSLSDFQTSDNSHFDYLSQIEENASFTLNGANSSVASIISIYTGSSSVIENFNTEKVQWYTMQMTTRVYIVDNEGNHSGYYTETYDFLTGQQKTDSKTLLQNNNPYSTGSYNDDLTYDDVDNNNNEPSVGNNNIPMSNNGSSGNSSASAVTGDNNIVINNNPTFNNDNSSGSSGGGVGTTNQSAVNFYNTFNPFSIIFNKLNGNNSVISDETVETIGANKFITFMSSTFSFIPIEMWSTLTLFLGASLTILIVAVVLRVILDLL